MNKYLPSKKFIKFFGVVIGVAVLVWLVSFLFSETSVFENKKRQDLAVGESDSVYTIDTDGDGIYDWEEGLWGTDSKKVDTNDDGVSDADEIEDRRRELSEENGRSGVVKTDEPLSQTELFARQFIATASLVEQGGGLTPDALEGFSTSLKQSIESSTIKDPFTLLDLKLSSVTFLAYKKSLEPVFAPIMASETMELDAISRLAEGDASAEIEVAKVAELYANLSAKLLATPTPHSLAGPHLGMVNNAAKISIALFNIGKISEDPLLAMLGLKQYQDYSAALEKNINVLAANLN